MNRPCAYRWLAACGVTNSAQGQPWVIRTLEKRVVEHARSAYKEP